jgi:hypothetical protein
MKPFITSLLVLLLFCTYSVKAQEQQVVPYTLADRDRAIRTEVKMEALEAKMDLKFESVQKQIDQLSSLFYWGFGILISLFLFNLGYTIWDRRTALKPALDKADSANYKSTNLTNALREYAQKHPDLANILRTHGLL